MIRVPFVFFLILLFTGCSKEIEEPKHKNKGKNFIYLKIDDQEFLIKEGFSLNRNVIRAEIGGQAGEENPTYYEDVAFGEKYGSLTINFGSKSSEASISQGSINLDYFIEKQNSMGLLQFIHLPFFSNKYQEKIQFHSSSYNSPGKIEIINHNEERQIIEGTYKVSYYDFSDTTKRGDLYLYFDLHYEKQ